MSSSRVSPALSYPVTNGVLGERAVFVSLPGSVPDGLAFDSAGTLFVSCWRPDRVYRVESDGTATVLLDDPTGEYLTTPTNLCFGGSDLKRLYFASLGGWAIKELEMALAGQSLAHSQEER